MWKKLAFWALIAAAIAAVIKLLRPKPDFAMPGEGSADWPPLDLPGPDGTASPDDTAASPDDTASSEQGAGDWVEPNEDGSCPDGYPVKVKLSSGIFHVPGGLSYERTNPDRCYPTATAAENDGFRQSQR